MENMLLGPLGGMFALGFSAGAVAGYGFALRVHTKALIEAATAPLSVEINHLKREVTRLTRSEEILQSTVNDLFQKMIGKEDGRT
jgi:hypothetical protein